MTCPPLQIGGLESDTTAQSEHLAPGANSHCRTGTQKSRQQFGFVASLPPRRNFGCMKQLQHNDLHGANDALMAASVGRHIGARLWATALGTPEVLLDRSELRNQSHYRGSHRILSYQRSSAPEKRPTRALEEIWPCSERSALMKRCVFVRTLVRMYALSSMRPV